jgi:hypothetical protein
MGKYARPPHQSHTDKGYSKVRTRDMGGNSTTHEFVRTILDKLEAAA